MLGVLAKIFTWWSSATLGTLFTISRRGRLVGEDEQGNRYYEEKRASHPAGMKRRWVVYNGYAEHSRVPPEWHGWLHGVFQAPPTVERAPQLPWMKPHLPNLTGSPMAYKPKGSLSRGADAELERDYEAWTPGS